MNLQAVWLVYAQSRLFPVVQESLEADISEDVVKALLKHIKGYGCYIRTHEGCLNKVLDTPDAGSNYLGVEVVIVVQDLPDLGYHLHTLVADVVQAANKGGDVSGTDLSG